MNLDWKNYGLHSLWSGWASLAAHNRVSDRLFKPHVRWKSHLESPLSVSKNLIISYSPQKLPLLLGTLEHGSTSRKLSFSFTHPVVEENKVIFVWAKRIRMNLFSETRWLILQKWRSHFSALMMQLSNFNKITKYSPDSSSQSPWIRCIVSQSIHVSQAKYSW